MIRALGLTVGIASALLAFASDASAASSGHQIRHTLVRKQVKPKPCYAHYRAAHAVNAVRPVIPALAAADGVTGTVEVLVTVRANGGVTEASAVSGPVLLRQAAVDAALATTFVPEIRDCHPIPGAYSYFVDFNGA